MSPITFDQTVALGGLLVAAISLVAGFWRSTRGDAAGDQLVNDKLDRMGEVGRETRDAVREMSAKLDDHSQRLARVENDVENIYHRLSRVEATCDARHQTGGAE